MKYTEKQARVLLLISKGGKIKYIKTENKDHRNLVLFEDGTRIYFYEYEGQQIEDIADDAELLEQAYELLQKVKEDAVIYYGENRMRWR